MSSRPLVFLLVVVAVLFCVILALRLLDQEVPTDDPEGVPAATRPASTPSSQPKARTEPTPIREPVNDVVAPAERGTGLEAAHAALDLLESLLRSPQASDEDLLAALARVRDYYLRPPPPGDEDAGRSAQPVLQGSKFRMWALDAGWSESYLERVEAFRKRAEKALLKALRLVQLDDDGGKNLREGVNTAAALAIGDGGNPKLADDVIRSLEGAIFKARYEVSESLLDAAFGAVARLGGGETIEWLVEEFTHTKSSPPATVDQLVAAHKALLLVDPKDLEGRLRYDLVKEFVATYAGVEALASARDSNATAFWERIGPGVIAVIQRYGGAPKDENDRPLDTVNAFQEWLRDHKNPRRPPWSE